MSGPAVAHLTTAIAVVGGGMLAGHVLAPFGPGAGPGRCVLFAVAMLALGAWRGHGEWLSWATWSERPLVPRHGARFATLGALIALLLATAGYAVAHG